MPLQQFDCERHFNHVHSFIHPFIHSFIQQQNEVVKAYRSPRETGAQLTHYEESSEPVVFRSITVIKVNNGVRFIRGKVRTSTDVVG